MPLDEVRTAATAAIADALEASFGHRPDEVLVEVPPRRDLGDLAWPGALQLARVLRRAPRDIAGAVASAAAWPPMVARVEVAGPGFVNLFLDRTRLLQRLLRADHGRSPGEAAKVIVEHTNINPNKAAHIGHLRNAVLGDILVRCLRSLGASVEVQNYVDDTGVQVADIVVGLLYLPETDVSDALGVETRRRDELIDLVLERLPAAGVPVAASDDFDDLCWDLYPRVTARYADEPSFTDHRTDVLHMIEEGPGELDLEQARYLLRGAVIAGEPFPAAAVATLAGAVADGNLRCHLATMARLGIAYDLLPHESDILRLGFWQRAFDLLTGAGAVRLVGDGKNAGCWVMSLASSPAFADMEDPDKILVRSNGTVTYTGKDIAYQLWKLGLLRDADGERQDFGYRDYVAWSRSGPARPVRYGAGGSEHLYRSTSDPADSGGARDFGAGDSVYNVIDVRQSYPQKVVREAVRVLGHEQAADRSVHFSYEMVALTPAAVRLIEQQTGADFGLSDADMAKPYVEMSGRRGVGVKADEFLDILVGAAESAILERVGHDGTVADLTDRAEAIAVGALRYLMARQSRSRVLAFDFDEALAFEGDTGPYLQYSAVRAAKIFDKLAERRGESRLGADEVDALAGLEVGDDLWQLVLECGRRREVTGQAVSSLEFSLLDQHVHNLAQLFHKLYHAHPVVQEADDAVRRLRRAVFTLYADEIRYLLEELLGIPVPDEM